MDGNWWATRPWGDWGTWAGAIGTVLAVVVALWQLRSERLARAAESLDRDKREAMDQATRITAWMAKVTFNDEEPQDDEEERNATQGIVIQNSSEQAIFSVTVTTFKRESAAQSFDDAEQQKVFIRSVPPGVWYTEAIDGFTSGDRNLVLPISFHDCRGKAWKRGGNGELDELEEVEVPRAGRKIPICAIQCVGPLDAIA